MHLQTHVMSGWCAANCLKLTARERFLAMTAAVLPDLDGITYVFGQEAYWATHHIYGHNLLFVLAGSGILAAFCAAKLKCFLLFFFLMHLHLVMDLLGSGEGWTISYWFPFGRGEYAWSFGWDFDSVENKLAGLFFLLWCVWIAIYRRRTPLEWPMPKLDAQLVALAQKLPKLSGK